MRPTGPRLFRRVTIVGIGLMGGSLGLAIKKRGLAREVVGLVRRRQTSVRARALGAVDFGTLSVERAVHGSDLVVIAAPLSRTLDLLQTLAPHLAPGCLVTDIGSAKVEFLQEFEKVFYLPDLVAKTVPPPPRFTFVSSHPMAGSEKAGVESARRDLYEGSTCLLIRTRNTSAEGLHRLQEFWRAVGCRHVVVVSAAEHDRWVAAVSHLPHVLAVSLINLLAELSTRTETIVNVVGSGFRDTTRIAGGSPDLWLEILMSNREQVGAMIDRLRHHLARVEAALKSGETRRLRELLAQASAFRQNLEKRRRVR